MRSRLGGVAALLLLGACGGNWHMPYPQEEEVRMRTVVPEALGPEDGRDWRRGVNAAEGRRYRDAAAAFIDELDSPHPVESTGARLLAVLPLTDKATQRRAARVQGGARKPIGPGFDGVTVERLAMLRCGWRPVAFVRVACDREEGCHYRFACQGGGRREIVRRAPELWFE